MMRSLRTALASSLLTVAAAAAPAGSSVTLDGRTSVAPAAWREVSPGPMRPKQFVIAAQKGDPRDAEVMVFHFGSGQGGSAADNITRWKSMFEPPQGQTIDRATHVQTFAAGGFKITYLDVHGTYLYRPRPADTSIEPERRPSHRMLAAALEGTDNGPFFVRFVGPEKTVGAHKAEFDAWLKAFH
jgi:hypothetical protein